MKAAVQPASSVAASSRAVAIPTDQASSDQASADQAAGAEAGAAEASVTADSAVTRPRYMSIQALLEQLEYLGHDHMTLPLANPLSSDMDVKRTTLMPGLLNSLSRNLRRQQGRVRLFESGVAFLQGETMNEVNPFSRRYESNSSIG